MTSPPARWIALLTALLSGVVVLHCCPPAAAQSSAITSEHIDYSVFTGGHFYFCIVHNESGEIVLRGRTDDQGLSQVILAPNDGFLVHAIYSETLSVGISEFQSVASGGRFQIPRSSFYHIKPNLSDQDGDGLPDFHEDIVGTIKTNPDSDNDGFDDKTEIKQGRNPLDGYITATGIVGSAPINGTGRDICATRNLVAIAAGAAGVTIYNVKDGAAPVRVAELDTPGNAQAIACYQDLLVVADGQGGALIVDIEDPPAARIIQQRKFDSTAPVVAVAAQGNWAALGHGNGVIVLMDIITGNELGRASVVGTSGELQDVGIRGNKIYALHEGALTTFQMSGERLVWMARVSSPGQIGAGRERLRLFVGGRFLYATHTQGYNIFELTDSGTPEHQRQFSNSQFGWKQIVANGSGLALAATSPNSTADGPHHVDLYGVGDGIDASQFLAVYPTPGKANSVSIYNGLGFVADGSRGLQVINFRAWDNQGQAPTISLRSSTSLDPPRAEEGSLFSVETEVTDDVQVRHVEFYVDDVLVGMDGSFPFSFAMLAPTRTGSITSFSFRAEAVDTGGNRASTEQLQFELLPDATPPEVVSIRPANGNISGLIPSVVTVFSEAIDPTSFSLQSLELCHTGPDGIFQTADDRIFSDYEIRYDNAARMLALKFLRDLDPGSYRLTIRAPLADLAGNAIAEPHVSSFRIYGFNDEDRDGLPDALEELLDLDPLNPDTDGNGVSDGLEDADGDRLINLGEVLLNTNPLVADTDGNGILDGDEDSDFDGAADWNEVLAGTNPEVVDTDGDLVSDFSEIFEGTNPIDPLSFPRGIELSTPTVSYLNAEPRPLPDSFRYSLASPLLTYLNAAQSPLPSTYQYSLSSPVLAFLNASPSPLPPAFQYALSSPVISFLNAEEAPLPNDFVYTVSSPVVSWRNEASP